MPNLRLSPEAQARVIEFAFNKLSPEDQHRLTNGKRLPIASIGNMMGLEPAQYFANLSPKDQAAILAAGQ